jgi:cation transport regulator ChaB
MPKTTKSGRPIESELPDTLKRSPAKAQRQFAKTHDAAAEQYGEGERAHRTAYASLKHNFEKVGDHWEPKGRKGPSDPQAARSTPSSRKPRSTAGGVDANASKAHLMDVAKRLDISGRSRMTKDELVTAIQKANNRKTASAR